MLVFQGFKPLARFILDNPFVVGSFSARVNDTVSDSGVHEITWEKGKTIRRLDGQFMTWANTGGIVVWN